VRVTPLLIHSGTDYLVFGAAFNFSSAFFRALRCLCHATFFRLFILSPHNETATNGGGRSTTCLGLLCHVVKGMLQTVEGSQRHLVYLSAWRSTRGDYLAGGLLRK
jgi:hypothetical protein